MCKCNPLIRSIYCGLGDCHESVGAFSRLKGQPTYVFLCKECNNKRYTKNELAVLVCTRCDKEMVCEPSMTLPNEIEVNNCSRCDSPAGAKVEKAVNSQEDFYSIRCTNAECGYGLIGPIQNQGVIRNYWNVKSLSYDASQNILTEPGRDIVNNPKHYNSSGVLCTCGRQIECIDITRHMDFNIGNAVKYLWRYKHKNGLEDLKKARWYLDDEIKRMESK